MRSQIELRSCPVTSSIEESYNPEDLEGLDLDLAGLSEEFNDILSIPEGTTFPVNKGKVAVITSSDLHIFTEKKLPSLTVVLSKLPEHGQLFYKEEPMSTEKVLVKDDFDRGHVVYHHTDSTAESDSFIFHIVDESAHLSTDNEFMISIIEEHNDPVLVEFHPLFVKKGAVLTITNELLQVADAHQSPDALVYTLSKIPKHGSLINSEIGMLVQTDTFTQQDIDDGLIFYEHHNSGDPTDQFVFSVSDGVGGTIENTTLNFFIVERDFALIVNNPLLAKPKKRVPLTENHLNVMHMGGNKVGLHYILTALPKRGSLVLSDTVLREGDIFTQQDIDDGRIRFELFSKS